ncbi:MAG: murein biosynthesis integral membrane protein MurJ [Aquihabitans sp.]
MSTEDDSNESEVLRPRTVRPGTAKSPPPVIRPRTVAAFGRPDPIIPPPPESFGGGGWEPPTNPVAVIDLQQEPDAEPHDQAEADIESDADLGPTGDVEQEPEGGPPGTGADAVLDVDEPIPASAITGPGWDDDWDDIWVDGARTGEVVDLASGGAAVDIAEDPADTSVPPANRMLRNNLFVASGTAVSRLTGLVRTTLIITLMIEGLPDAYINANNTPNMIYELILGGVLTATLVPLFTDDLEKKGRDGATSAIISFALVALVAVTLLAAILAPLLILLLSTGSPDAARDDYVYVGIRLSLLFAPQVFFYGLMAVWSAVLNARHRFLAAAWAPVLNNLVAIATLFAVWKGVGHYPTLTEAVDNPRIIWVLGLGTTSGIVIMALSLYPSVRRAGVRLEFNPSMKHPAVRRAIRLSGWTFGYVVANLVALFIVQILAAPGSDDVAKYTTAFQFFQLPHGLLAVSIMVTFEPLLGRADSRGDRKEFNKQLLLGFRLIGLLVIPAAVGYIALPKGLDHRTFTGGASIERAFSVTGIVAAFAIGLPGFSSYLYALRAFYAMKNTKIPFIINCFENALNIVLAIILVRVWGVVGLALAFGLAYSVTAVIAVAVLVRHSPGFDWRGLINSWLRLLAAALVMGGVVYWVVITFPPGTQLATIPVVGGAIVVGALVYFAAVFVLRVQGISELLHRLPLLRRFAPGR